MIHINRKRVAAPTVLDPKGSIGSKEMDHAEAFYKKKKT
jgi:hypothetical protein